MSQRLGRAVRFRVAALDYFTGKNPVLRGARLIAKEDLDRLLRHINLDEVTSVYTRRYFNERLHLEVNRARRYGSHLSLLVIDLDDFKRVNDQLGHLRGDSLLRRVARLLRESTRQSDVVCRYGGNEFAILLPETSASEAYTLAERIRSASALAALAELDGDASARDRPAIRVGVGHWRSDLPGRLRGGGGPPGPGRPHVPRGEALREEPGAHERRLRPGRRSGTPARFRLTGGHVVG